MHTEAEESPDKHQPQLGLQAWSESCLACVQDKQKAQQEHVYELSEQVAELEERQRGLEKALDACRQVSISCLAPVRASGSRPAARMDIWRTLHYLYSCKRWEDGNSAGMVQDAQAEQQSGGAVLELDLLQIHLTQQELDCMDRQTLSVIWKVKMPFQDRKAFLYL